MRVRRHKNYIDKPFDELAPCGTPSPDLSLTCTRELGHLGWCTHTPSDTSWFLDNWAIDQYADTAEAAVDPEPTMSAEEWNRLHKPSGTQSTRQPPIERPHPQRRRKFTKKGQLWADIEYVNAICAQKNYLVSLYRMRLTEAKYQGNFYIG